MDTEQVQRDLERIDPEGHRADDAGRLASHCRALLFELGESEAKCERIAGFERAHYRTALENGLKLEQAERENWALKEELGSPDDPESWVSLKARLAEAERERDAKDDAITVLLRQVHELEARLAAVPALLSAATKALPLVRRDDRFAEVDYQALREALTAYEQAQE